MPGKPDLARRAMARRLRQQGHSLSQIAAMMGLKSTGVLSRWLKGVPPPAWTRRPRAKDHLRKEALRLRREGRSYKEIRSVLGVSMSSLSLWLRDIPLTQEHRAALAEKQRDAIQRRADSIRAASRAREARLIHEAGAQIGALDERDLFIAGVVAYWAEGAKTKPWGARASVDFVNSDRGLVRLFLHWLQLLGIEKEDVVYRVAIHETADAREAVRYWSTEVGVPAERFKRTTLKRHKVRTNRKNVGRDYRGCLNIRVRCSTDLNSRIRGWFDGIVSGIPTD